MNYKKYMINENTFKPKDIIKHKHDYKIRCILEITNQNIHASSDYYGKKEYHEVLKCTCCNSFIPDSKDCNYDGIIFDEKNIDNKLPLIKANTNYKNPKYNFKDLYDVEYKGN